MASEVSAAPPKNFAAKGVLVGVIKSTGRRVPVILQQSAMWDTSKAGITNIHAILFIRQKLTINPGRINSDHTLGTMGYYSHEFYRAFTGLKAKKPSLKCFLSVGGWDAGGRVFSNMASSAGSRKVFIESVIKTLAEFGFDGLDIDWEYPVADDRGGSKSDYNNYVLLLRELKDAFGTKYGLTMAIPASYWYLRGFDLKNMVKYVDWFNVMSYDIHGTWDGHSAWTKEVINPHTNLTEISMGLDLLWRNSVPAEKVLLGLGFYGRSFTLGDPRCNTPGCSFKRTGDENSGGALPGRCTLNSGTLSDYEINRVLKSKSPELVYNEEAGVNWITWDKDQWVSFDDARTLKQKASFANNLCLGGTFAWALDLGGPGTMGRPDELNGNTLSLDGADPEGSDSGSGDVYLSPEIYKIQNPGNACIPPCTFIMPRLTLDKVTTITFPPYVTSLEVAWWTASAITLPGGAISSSIWQVKTIQTTTLTIPPLTTSVLDMWNWPVTKSGLSSTTYVVPATQYRGPAADYRWRNGGSSNGQPLPGGSQLTPGRAPDATTTGAFPPPGSGASSQNPTSGQDTEAGIRPASDRSTTGVFPPPTAGKTTTDQTKSQHSPPATGGSLDGITTLSYRPPTTRKSGNNPTDKHDSQPTSNSGPESSTDGIILPPGSHIRPTESRGSGSQESGTSSSFPPGTRTITPRPHPLTSETDNSKLPTVSWTEGPPSPTCTKDCGTKCEGPFCDCKGDDCGNHNKDFIDPNDTHPPKDTDRRKCFGPGCDKGNCPIGLNILWTGCKDGFCEGSDCKQDTGECEKPETAPRCTEVVSKYKRSQSVYSSTTTTRCKTVTACSATETTVTSTTTVDAGKIITITEHYPVHSLLSNEEYSSIARRLREERISRDKSRFHRPKTTVTILDPGTRTIHSPPEYTTAHIHDKGRPKCMNDGDGSAYRREIILAVSAFCRSNDEQTMKRGDDARMMTTRADCKDGKDCGAFMTVGLKLSDAKGCESFLFNGRGDRDDQCGQNFRKITDECDTRGENNKKGGSFSSGCAMWFIDIESTKSFMARWNEELERQKKNHEPYHVPARYNVHYGVVGDAIVKPKPAHPVDQDGVLHCGRSQLSVSRADLITAIGKYCREMNGQYVKYQGPILKVGYYGVNCSGASCKGYIALQVANSEYEPSGCPDYKIDGEGTTEDQCGQNFRLAVDGCGKDKENEKERSELQFNCIHWKIFLLTPYDYARSSSETVIV
ncbi:uncharacterized protein GIQ15_06125 [Arthroderma uncinatum]|uniref:uncharacterized protein n=1 Tax=Arthroderma uncinatum TaxID=74035 RepID=UPI00144A7260|nr:uncharacterized protein GIQ15_06125 [Arthroderma uncinatum]KAF3480778.1 hypothetical protein GIQ15_06125 [Arthroderma uncinatum]